VPVVAGLAWLGAGALLLASGEVWRYLYSNLVMDGTTINHLQRAYFAVVCTLLAAAYLLVRRATPGTFAVLPVVLLATWGVELFPFLVDMLGAGMPRGRVSDALFLTGATALMAGLVALAVVVGRRPSPVPAAPTPYDPRAFPAAPADTGAWAAQQHPAQGAWPAQVAEDETWGWR
jgi:hypothetical protein